MNIIQAYADVHQDDLARGLRILSIAADMTIDSGVFSRWRTGQRTPPAKVVRLMAAAIAQDVLQAHGIHIKTGQAMKLAMTFCPPERAQPREPQ